MDPNDDFNGKELNLNCFYMRTMFGQKYPKPAIVCGRTCVVCDQLKNTRTHAHRTQVLKVFSHAHAYVRPHIARVRPRKHLRNSALVFFISKVLVKLPFSYLPPFNVSIMCLNVSVLCLFHFQRGFFRSRFSRNQNVR